MMAGVFLMQPLGQVFAASVGWGVLNIVKGRGLSNLPVHGADLTEDQKLAILSAIDTIWRWVIGAGCIPAAASILWRFAIPESPRYTMDNNDNATQAYYNVRRYRKKKDNEVTAERVRQGQPPDRATEATRGAASGSSHTAPSAENVNGGATTRRLVSNSLDTAATVDQTRQSSRIGEQNVGSLLTNTSEHLSTTGIHPVNIANNGTGNLSTYSAPICNDTQVTSSVATETTKITFYQHFFEDGNWRYLFATSMCWFFLDFAFYALGINNPRQISAIWDDYLPLPERNSTRYDWPSTLLIGINNPTFSNETVPDWQNPFDPNTNIYHELFDSAKQYILTISCGSLVGSVLVLYYINNIPRKMWLVYSFLILALLFAVLGAFYKRAAFTESHWATVVFYILCQFFFNLGKFSAACPKKKMGHANPT
jgi:PHS family inorganic phosphate transporter-like MFS transporter